MSKEPKEVDLNKVRDLIKSGQRAADDSRIPTAQQVFVDRGKLVLGEDIENAAAPTITRIDTETPFAARIESERLVVSNKFPRGTQRLVVTGVDGWLYDVKCESGNKYTFFTYYDDIDGYYKTKVVEPFVEKKWRNMHTGHIYTNTVRLCLSTDYNGGAPTLETAFARTVLWANGFSLLQKTGTFPFSI